MENIWFKAFISIKKDVCESAILFTKLFIALDSDTDKGYKNSQRII